MTKQRECILRVVRENIGHFTAEEIFELARKDFPGIAVATVYNNLNALVDCREIKRISRVGKPDVFDKSIRPHEHLICTCCERIYDLDLPSVRTAMAEGLKREIEDYDLIIHAKCDNCTKTENKLPPN